MKNTESNAPTGACIYCGQMAQFETIGDVNPAQLDAWATEKCSCNEAKEARKKLKSKNAAEEYVKKMYEEDMPEVAEMLITGIELIYKAKIENLSININGITKAKISMTAKGNIKVEKNTSLSEVKIG